MNKYYVLTLLSLTLLCCNNSNGSDDKVDRTNPNIPNIIDLLEETYSDTVFYKTNEDQIIGEIHRAQYFNDDIYIIDGPSDQVLAFTAEGDFKEYVGRIGRGPGEYLKPESFTIYGENMVLLDSSLNRISHYKYDSHTDGFKIMNSAIHDFYMSDICEINGDIWVYGYKAGNIIHKLSNDLEKIEISGGNLASYDQDIIMSITSDGHIACSDNYIYSGFSYDNTIHVYSAYNGTYHDKIVINDATPIEISFVIHEGTERFGYRGYMGTAYNEKGNYHDALKNLTIVNNIILAQYSRFYQEYRPLNPKLTSYVIDPENHTYRIFHEYPLILDFNNKSYLTISNDSLSFIVNRVK